MIKDIVKIILGVIILAALADFTALLAWVYSGQTPPDTFYFGSSSAAIIRKVYKIDGFNGRNYIDYSKFDPETGKIIIK